jgi:hypothetical protein
MEPSAFWWFSNTATKARPTAKPEPFKVCTNSFLPWAFLKRACKRRAWEKPSVRLLQPTHGL